MGLSNASKTEVLRPKTDLADDACQDLDNMRRWRWRTIRCRVKHRRGVAALDYVLVLGVVLPMVAFVFVIGPRIMHLAYEMVCVLVSWPFM